MTDEEKKKRQKENSKKYYQKNKERIKAYANEYYAKKKSDGAKKTNVVKKRKYPNGIILLTSTIKLEFIPTEESLYRAKRELIRHLLNIKNEDRIVIVDNWNKLVTVEVYEKNEDCIQLIINELDDFLKNISKKFVS